MSFSHSRALTPLISFGPRMQAIALRSNRIHRKENGTSFQSKAKYGSQTWRLSLAKVAPHNTFRLAIGRICADAQTKDRPKAVFMLFPIGVDN